MLRKLRLKFMQIRTILYQYKKTLIKHVFLLNFTHELLMSFRSVYKMSGRSASVYTDTSASHEYLCTLILNIHEFCKLLIKRPQIVMFSNYI